MKKFIKSDEGFTLIELLASIALLSVVILLVGSFQIFGQTQYVNQTESASQSNDLRYSLSLISRDIRRAEQVTASNPEEGVGFEADGVIYNWDRPKLSRNGEVLSTQVDNFSYDLIDDGVEITIRSTPNRQNQSEKYQTTIYFRR